MQQNKEQVVDTDGWNHLKTHCIYDSFICKVEFSYFVKDCQEAGSRFRLASLEFPHILLLIFFCFIYVSEYQNLSSIIFNMYNFHL